MKTITKLIIGIMAILLILSIITHDVKAKTDSEKIDDLNDKTDKMEKLLEKIDKNIEKDRLSLSVFGTEYQIGDPTTTFVQVLRDNLEPVDNASCFVTIWYPDKNIWYNRVMMTHLPSSNGIYYFDATAQTQIGVYMVDVVCQYTTGDEFFNATLVEIINGTYVAGTNASVTILDEDRFEVDETGSGLPVIAELVAYWNLDETSGTSVANSGNNGINATVNGNPDLTVAGTINTGAELDGIDDYFYTADAADFDIGLDEDFVVCISFNSSAVTGVADARLFKIEEGGGDKIEVKMDKNLGTIESKIKRNGIEEKPLTVAAYDDDTWYRYCLSHDTVTLNATIDGVTVASATLSESAAMDFDSGFFIGADQNGNNVFDGQVDEVCMWKGEDLDIKDIVANYQINRCSDILAINRTLDVEVTITNVQLSAFNLDELFISTTYQWSGVGEGLEVSAWNFTGGQWVLLENNLTYSVTDSTVTHQLFGNYTDYLDGSNNILIRYHDEVSEEFGVHRLKLNWVSVIAHNHIDTPITEIRGAGEIHVNDWFVNQSSEISEAVWQYSDRTLTEFDFDVVNETEIAEEVWSFENRTLTEFLFNVTLAAPINITAIAEGVWNYFNRTLSFFQFDLVDEEKIAANVWNYTDRNLTYFPEVNLNTLANLTAEEVWSYTHRNLTYYPECATTPEIWNYSGRYTHGVLGCS